MNLTKSMLSLLRKVADAPVRRDVLVRETATPFCQSLRAKRSGARACGARDATVDAAEAAGYITVRRIYASVTRDGFTSSGVEVRAIITPAGLAALGRAS